MKKIFIATALLLSCIMAGAENLHITTQNISLLLKADKGDKVRMLYFGSRLSEKDLPGLASAGVPGTDIYPAYGQDVIREYALAVKHSDGNMTLDLIVDFITRDETSDYALTTICLEDSIYPMRVFLNFKAFKDVDMIETWTEIQNLGKKPVELLKYDSCFLPVRVGDVWLSHLYGTWGNEGRLVEEPLNRGILTIKNKDGVRNSQTEHAEVMFSLDGKPRENSGDVIGAALCYSGNYELSVITKNSDYHYFTAGICSEASAYPLQAKESFCTPEVALTFSKEGVGGASRNFHRWARSHKLAHGDRLRDILLNSWEGVYFKINEPGMAKMMEDIAALGGELFVMDDGWFGDKYPRLNDHTSLGDWTVDSNKLPSGVSGLVETARRNGIKFGIWIEPEMANTASELYEKHPEWIINAPNRDVIQGRGGTQVVLDMGNPLVQDYVFSIVDNLMTQNPGIAYIKWDANMDIRSHGSYYQRGDEQSKLFIEYHRGLASVCDRIRAKYPDVTIQACASGGGRASYGILPWFDEFWVSDNTDALQRIYMQWGASYFFPSMAMASHISAVPNHTVQRVTPLKFRIDVAMSARLGMELQPADMTPLELAQCRQAIADYKLVRPVVQLGDQYRLVSPYDGKGVASMMYVAPDKKEAVFYWWKTEYFQDQRIPRIKMEGLDPDRMYEVTELDRLLFEDGKTAKALDFEGKTFSGRFLMDNGLEIPGFPATSKEKNAMMAYTSRVLRLVAKD